MTTKERRDNSQPSPGVINKMLNYFSSSTVFGVIRLSYSECNHNVTEIARFSKGDFGNVHCNTESVDSNTDWTQVWWLASCNQEHHQFFHNLYFQDSIGISIID